MPAVGNFTVGSGAGDDFATWALAYAAILNLTGDLTYTQTTATNEVAQASTGNILNGHSFTCNSQTPHNGDPTGGLITTHSFNTHGFNMSMEGPGTVNMYDLYLRGNAPAPVITSALNCSAVGTGFTFNFHDILLDGNGGAYRTGLFYLNDNTPNYYFWNIFGWDADLRGVYMDSANASSIFENITIYDSGIGFEITNEPVTIRNCAGVGNTTDFSNIGAATGRNNASDDATAANGNWAVGTNNNINIVAATEFESLLDNTANFLKVTNAGVCGVGGQAVGIAANTTGIRDNARPGADALISIGADELEVATPDTGYNINSNANGWNRQYCFRMNSAKVGF